MGGEIDGTKLLAGGGIGLLMLTMLAAFMRYLNKRDGRDARRDDRDDRRNHAFLKVTREAVRAINRIDARAGMVSGRLDRVEAKIDQLLDRRTPPE